MRAAWILPLFAAATLASGAGSAPLRIPQLDSPNLPPQLQPAASFQNVFFKIVGGAQQTEWLPDLEKLTQSESGVRDLARVWLARVQIARIDQALRGYYTDNIRFPESLEEANPPADLRVDPWGEKWSYHLTATPQFPAMNAQRYQLGPARLPQLTSFADAVRSRPPVPDWKATVREIGGKKAIELSSGASLAPVATLEEGGSAENCTLLYIGDNWILMAATDQLFALPF